METGLTRKFSLLFTAVWRWLDLRSPCLNLRCMGHKPLWNCHIQWLFTPWCLVSPKLKLSLSKISTVLKVLMLLCTTYQSASGIKTKLINLVSEHQQLPCNYHPWELLCVDIMGRLLCSSTVLLPCMPHSVSSRVFYTTTVQTTPEFRKKKKMTVYLQLLTFITRQNDTYKSSEQTSAYLQVHHNLRCPAVYWGGELTPVGYGGKPHPLGTDPSCHTTMGHLHWPVAGPISGCSPSMMLYAHLSVLYYSWKFL